MFEQLVERLSDYDVVLEPDENIPEWWAGAPSVVRGADGTFFLAARMRHADSPKGRRGYAIRILRSADGRHFEPVANLTREEAGVPGFERPCLLLNQETGRFSLLCCADLEGHGWSILRFDDAKDPSRFDASTCRPVLTAGGREYGVNELRGFKDPVVHQDADGWHMFMIGFDRVERVHHFLSEDLEHWHSPQPLPIIENSGWHNFYTRPASVLPMAVGYLFVYEGSSIDWHDPSYNIATGLAYSPDLRDFYDLTPDAPLLESSTPGDYRTWRYSHWMRVKNEVCVYFEAARPNNTNEIRFAVLRANDFR